MHRTHLSRLASRWATPRMNRQCIQLQRSMFQNPSVFNLRLFSTTAKGVDLESSAFDDPLNKTHTYRLVEGVDDAPIEDPSLITVVDMTPFWTGGEEGKACFARQLGQALESIGFAVLTGHRIDPSLFDRVAATVPDVFLLPEEAKQPFRQDTMGSSVGGWWPFKHSSGIHADLVEGWTFTRPAFAVPQHDTSATPQEASSFWPAAGLEPVFREWVLEAEQLFLPLMQSMLAHLGVDPHAYDTQLTDTNFFLRLNYYPPVSEADDASGAGRLIGHEDLSLFTLLPAPEVEGLQVWHRGLGSWVLVQVPKGSIIFNTGDYMQRITNDRYPSTTHRVGKPRNGSHLKRSRVSFPVGPFIESDQMLEVFPELGEAKYPPIKAHDFHQALIAKFNSEK
mmetsp:Transcript_62751/g.148606  ORF Transcript_62751/g.148606 Transcript_62751/m.148606 type:complete len:394 (+) Transcript_62751:92-1273(+)